MKPRKLAARIEEILLIILAHLSIFRKRGKK